MWQWMKPGSTTAHLKQTYRQLTGQQLVELLLWDAHGILFIDYLEKCKTINSDYHVALLDRLSAEIKKKRSHMQKKKVVFHQDNAPCYKSMKTMVKLNKLSSRPGPQRLLALYWPGKNSPGKEIWLQWRSDCRNWGLFWMQRRIIL